MIINTIQALPIKFSSLGFKGNEEKKCNNSCEHCREEALLGTLDAVAAQNKGFVTGKNDDLEEFDTSTLGNKSIEDEFSTQEMAINGKRLPMNAVLNLIYSCWEIRYYEQTGELVPYKTKELLEKCRYKGLNCEQTQEYIQQAKDDFAAKTNSTKIQAIKDINLSAPTLEEHTVYRILNKPYEDYDKKSYEQIRKYSPNEIVKLSSSPIYVSTSAKKTINNYGGKRAKDGILFEIKLPKNSKLLKFPSGDGIEQCIMKPDAQFKVIKNEQYKNNFTKITLEYILPEDDLE